MRTYTATYRHTATGAVRTVELVPTGESWVPWIVQTGAALKENGETRTFGAPRVAQQYIDAWFTRFSFEVIQPWESRRTQQRPAPCDTPAKVPAGASPRGVIQ